MGVGQNLPSPTASCLMSVHNLLILSVYIVNALVSDALRDQHKWTSLHIDSHLRSVYRQACISLPVLTLLCSCHLICVGVNSKLSQV